jgi:hypothetical protein
VRRRPPAGLIRFGLAATIRSPVRRHASAGIHHLGD